MKTLARALAIFTAISASVIVWLKLLSMPDISIPFLQGSSFSLIMIFFACAVFGFTNIKKPLAADKAIELLQSFDFKIAQDTKQEQYLLNHKIMERQKIVFEFYIFDSSSDAIDFFSQSSMEIAQKKSQTHFERRVNSKKFCKYILESYEAYDVISGAGATIVHASSTPDDVDEIKTIMKAIHY